MEKRLSWNVVFVFRVFFFTEATFMHTQRNVHQSPKDGEKSREPHHDLFLHDSSKTFCQGKVKMPKKKSTENDICTLMHKPFSSLTLTQSFSTTHEFRTCQKLPKLFCSLGVDKRINYCSIHPKRSFHYATCEYHKQVSNYDLDVAEMYHLQLMSQPWHV